MTDGPSEDALIARLAEHFMGKAAPPELWIGDDAAVLVPPEGRLLLATDAVVAGVHVDLDIAGLDDLGWKAMAVNLSDIAAMGGTPHRAVVSVVAPDGTDFDLLYAGIAGAASAFACPVVGGDLSSTAGPLVVVVAVTGGAVRPVLRSGARPGDHIYVTGPLGASATGRAALLAGASPGDPLTGPHLRPVPRVAEGQAACAAGATAMIDVSDGFALDLHRLADSSGVGFELDMVPVVDGATLDQALCGGEDYELVFTLPPAAHLDFAVGLRPPVRVGWCVEDPEVRRFLGEPLGRVGWQHRF